MSVISPAWALTRETSSPVLTFEILQIGQHCLESNRIDTPDSPQDTIFITRYCAGDIRKCHDCLELVHNIVHVDILIHRYGDHCSCLTFGRPENYSAIRRPADEGDVLFIRRRDSTDSKDSI